MATRIERPVVPRVAHVDHAEVREREEKAARDEEQPDEEAPVAGRTSGGGREGRFHTSLQPEPTSLGGVRPARIRRTDGRGR